MDWWFHFQKGTLLLYKSTLVCRKIAERFPEVMALPDDEKFRFIAELWDDVTGGEVPEPLAWQREENKHPALRHRSVPGHGIDASEYLLKVAIWHFDSSFPPCRQ